MICFYLSRPTLWRVALSFMIWELLSNAHENRPKNRSQFTIAFFWYQSDFLLIILESRTRLWCIGSSWPHIHPSRPPGLSVCRRYPWVEERPLIKRTSGVTRSTQLMGNSLPWWFKLQRADTRRFLIFDRSASLWRKHARRTSTIYYVTRWLTIFHFLSAGSRLMNGSWTYSSVSQSALEPDTTRSLPATA